MSRFYTSLTKHKDKIIERYVENGVRGTTEVHFKPKLFVPSQDQNSEHHSLGGLPLQPVLFDNIYAMDQWLDEMKNVPNYKIYGIDNPLAQYVAERYPEKQIAFDMKFIRGALLDIEVESGYKDAKGDIFSGPFPEPALAQYEVTAITVYDTFSGKFFVFGLETFKGEYIGTFDVDKLPPEVAKHIKPEQIEYVGYDSELDLLADFVDHFADAEYNYISGWNSDTFDIAYFCNRIDALLGRDQLKRISPLDYVRKRTFQGPYGEEVTFNIAGISNLDLKDIVDKHAFVELDNKKLNTAAKHFLGEEKVDHSDYKNLTEFYYKDYQNYISYNIHDVNLVKRIAEKTKMLQLAYTLAFLFHCNPDDTNATVLPWQYLMYGYGARGKEYSEIRPRVNSKPDYAGGYVKELNPGRYEDVVSVDANALYPHMAQQFNMGVETLIPWAITEQILDALAKELESLPEDQQDKYTRLYAERFRARQGIWDVYFERPYDFQVLKRLKVCMAPNLAMFKIERPSLLRRVFKDLYDTRSAIKRQMKNDERSLESIKKKYLDECLEQDAGFYKQKNEWETIIQNGDSNQHSHKIAANAGYGAIANENFADHFDIRIAEAITTAGQCSTRHIMFRLNEWINNKYNLSGDHCFYGDTDSVYVEFKEVVKAEGWDKLSVDAKTDKLDELAKNVLEPLFIQWAEELAASYNCPINALFFKREAISTVAIFTTKKRYAMLLTDNEGVRFATPKLKIVGLEARKSNYPMFCRDWMKKCYEFALNDQMSEMHQFVDACETDFKKDRDINEYGAAQNINNIEDYLDSSGNYVRGTPYHVKGAVNHNNLLKRLEVTHIMPLRSGNKYFVLPLRKGSPFGMEVISYDDQLPKEFKLDQFIDKETAFNKCFISPLTNFLTAINWEAKAPTSFSLDSLF